MHDSNIQTEMRGGGLLLKFDVDGRGGWIGNDPKRRLR